VANKRNLTAKKIAEIFHINIQTAYRLGKDGCPCSNGKPHKYNEDEVREYLNSEGRSLKPGRPKTQKSKDLEDIDFKLKQEKLEKLKQERKIREGSLHDVAECQEKQIQKIHFVKSELLSIPRVYAVRLVGKESFEIENILRDAVEHVCKVFSGEIETEA